MKHNERPLEVLKQYWGYDSFRPMQEDIIDTILAGHDCLTLLPTGGGKSLCYQVPAMVLDGICIVISPLVALMKDQVSSLRKIGINAEALHGGLHRNEIDHILDNCIYGKTKLLYLSPERLHSTLAEERIKRMPVSFVAVDEAHCISQWGHEFRPSYREIPVIREWHPNVPIIALTATATSEVSKDIIEQLHLNKVKRFSASFRRDNLSILAYETEDKPGLLVDIVRKTGGSGLVYVRSRRKTKEVAEILTRAGVRCEAYHAGMSHDQRSAIQGKWLAGETPVISCTTAFGMGIDKSDVGIVVHYDLPPSLEEYYQEAGRAGRDGNESFCVLLYHSADRTALQDTIVRSHPSAADVLNVYKALASYYHLPIDSDEPFDSEFIIRDFCKRYRLDIYITYQCLKVLEREGWLILSDSLHHPTRIQFTIEKDRLFEYQIAAPELNSLITSLLRNYEGVFLEPVRIDEATVRRACGMQKDELHEGLGRLHKDEILSYLPKSDNPRLTFLHPRVAAVNVDVNDAHITALRNLAMKRLDAVNTFLDEDFCREQVLLRYFGEENNVECGKCDLCRIRLSGIDSDKILERISDEGTPMNQIVGLFGRTYSDVVINHLRVMEDEQMIRIRDNIVYRKIQSST
jgi:ATP-dependent DNA helicase RecQ